MSLPRTFAEEALEVALVALADLAVDWDLFLVRLGVVLRPRFVLSFLSSSRSSFTSFAEAVGSCELEPLPELFVLRVRFQPLESSSGQSVAASVWRSHTEPK